MENEPLPKEDITLEDVTYLPAPKGIIPPQFSVSLSLVKSTY
jgi:hypothetical protein